MFRFTTRDLVMVVLSATAIALVALTVAAYGWWLPHSSSKAGQLRRGLEQVAEQTEQRDREIKELTGDSKP